MSVTNNGKQKRNKKKKRLIKLLIIVIILFILLMLAGTLLLQHRKNVDREQRKAEAIAALERVPTVTPTPAATPTPTPTPIPTATPTPVLERVFNPEDYLGTWRSKNGRVKIKIKKLSQKSVTFTYSQTNKKKTATCKAKVKKSVAGNATRFSFTDSLGNVAKGYLTFDNGRLYVNIKTKTKAEGAKVHPSVDTVMIKE